MRSASGVAKTIGAGLNANDWNNIVDISAGDEYAVGVKDNGRVVVVNTGENYYGECNVDNWSNIVAISAGGDHTIGLRANGTVVAVGDDDDGQCNVSGWANIKIPN